jgi:hypothetical protein
MSNPGLKVDLQMHRLAELFAFGVMIGFFERGIQDLPNDTNAAPQLANSFLSSHLQSIYMLI